MNDLTPEQKAQFTEALDRIQQEQDQARESEKRTPRRDFLARAERAGFTETQAKFLWIERFNQWDGRIG